MYLPMVFVHLEWYRNDQAVTVFLYYALVKLLYHESGTGKEHMFDSEMGRKGDMQLA
jgi:hypothetical protein